MSDVFATLLGQAQQYGKDQMATDPYALASKGIAAATNNAQFADPWANLLKNAVGGLATGYTQQTAQNNYLDNMNAATDAYEAGLKGEDVAPEFKPYFAAVNASRRDNQIKQQQKRAGLWDQIGKELYIEKVKTDADPDFQRRQKYDPSLQNPLDAPLAQVASRGSGGLLNGIPQQRGILPDRNPMRRVEQPIQDINAPEASAIRASLTQEIAEPTTAQATSQAAKNPSSIFDQLPDYEQLLHKYRGDETLANKEWEKINTARDSMMKRIDSIQKDFQTPDARTFSNMEQNVHALTQAIQDPLGTADVEIIRGVIQIIEPGLAVRNDDVAAIEQSGSIPGDLKQGMLSALSGETALSPQVRDGLMRIVKRRYDKGASKFNKETYGAAKRLADFYQVSDYAINRGPALSFEQIAQQYGYQPQTPQGKQLARPRAQQNQATSQQQRALELLKQRGAL